MCSSNRGSDGEHGQSARHGIRVPALCTPPCACCPGLSPTRAPAVGSSRDGQPRFRGRGSDSARAGGRRHSQQPAARAQGRRGERQGGQLFRSVGTADDSLRFGGKKVAREITKIITKRHRVLAARGSSAVQGAKQRLAPAQLRTRRWEEITPLSRHAARRRQG